MRQYSILVVLRGSHVKYGIHERVKNSNAVGTEAETTTLPPPKAVPHLKAIRHSRILPRESTLIAYPPAFPDPPERPYIVGEPG